MTARNFLIRLSEQHWIAHLAMRWNRAWKAAKRFIAGQILHDGLAVAQKLRKQHIACDLDHLGENVRTTADAKAAAEAYIATLNAIQKHRIRNVGISIKFTKLGLDISKKLCKEQVKRVLARAKLYDCFVRIDMEGSEYTSKTLDLFSELRKKHKNIGITLQAYLKRTPKDLNKIIRSRSSVRLVKGVYAEPSNIALQDRAEIRNSYLELLARLLQSKCHVAIATHNEEILNVAQKWIKELKIPKSRYEFQFLYGVKPNLWRRFAKKHPVRIYVPFGREWWPYYVRRLAERPANVFDLFS